MNPKHNRKPSRKPTAGRIEKHAKPVKLRVIGGHMRGRTIEYHGAEFTRPMKDNIRENLFNILGRAVKGAICFDLFAGTGAMAFESLSRGASSAVVIEQNRQAVKFIERTAESLEVSGRIRMITGDTFRLAGQLLAPPENDTPWIVFLCPPYVLWQESLQDLNRIIQTTLDNAPPGSVLVAETEKRFNPEKLPAGDWDLREYGGTRLAFIEPAMRCGLNL
jgi:16S rRNA (guanine966-N2)-methyltransferase